MKLRLSSLVQVSIPLFAVFLLHGCFGDGGGGPTYDGTWTAVYGDSAFAPTPASGVSAVVCTLPNPLPAVNIVNGAGTTSQTDTCQNTAAGTVNYLYLISVAIDNSTGAVSAVVNGSTLSGQCISPVGCAAQAGSQSLSLTR